MLKLFTWLRRGKEGQDTLPGAQRSVKAFEELIGYSFHQVDLIESALKHRSIIFETGEAREMANERLEFLGDAVLDLIVAELLYEKFPHSREGYLTRMKSLTVSGRQLSEKGRQMGLGSFLQISAGEERSGGRTRRSILEDALEAVIGAIYLDGGLEAARQFVFKFVIGDELDEHAIEDREKNFKSVLLEHVQGDALGHPNYRVVGEEGPDHSKVFHVEVLVNNEVVGKGAGRSKKQAEQNAAEQALKRYDLDKKKDEKE